MPANQKLGDANLRKRKREKLRDHISTLDFTQRTLTTNLSQSGSPKIKPSSRQAKIGMLSILSIGRSTTRTNLMNLKREKSRSSKKHAKRSTCLQIMIFYLESIHMCLTMTKNLVSFQHSSRQQSFTRQNQLQCYKQRMKEPVAPKLGIYSIYATFAPSTP